MPSPEDGLSYVQVDQIRNLDILAATARGPFEWGPIVYVETTRSTYEIRVTDTEGVYRLKGGVFGETEELKSPGTVIEVGERWLYDRTTDRETSTVIGLYVHRLVISSLCGGSILF